MKNVLITGGTSGIGYATAELLLEDGYQVLITGRKEATLNEVVKKLKNDLLQTIVSDTSNLKSIENLANEIAQKNEKFDVLFLNAGIADFAPIELATEEQFDAQFNTNVKGVYFTIKHLIPHLNDGASIIINGSTNATAANLGSSIYSATKAAVVKIAEIAANELASRKIRVNVVSPGPTLTPGLEGAVPKEALSFLSERTALQRIADPKEIGKVVKFLASEDSSFISGTEIVVDGGLLPYALK